MWIEYDIYIPTVSEAGESLASQDLNAIRKQLIERFGGLTDTRHKNDGFWKVGGFVVRDEIVIWRIMSNEGRAGDEFIRGVKGRLEALLKQDAILIVKRLIERMD